MNEEEKTTAAGTGGLQREAGGSVEEKKRQLRRQIKAIREGWSTGGYCESDALKVAEKSLHQILTVELSEAKQKHGYSPDPKFKHAEIRALELERDGLSYRPLLVEAAA